LPKNGVNASAADESTEQHQLVGDSGNGPSPSRLRYIIKALTGLLASAAAAIASQGDADGFATVTIFRPTAIVGAETWKTHVLA
jgi:hypothetical protein